MQEWTMAEILAMDNDPFLVVDPESQAAEQLVPVKTFHILLSN